jgi:transcriptional regulator GlxA family with amidase domain
MSLLGGTYGSREREISSSDAKRRDDCLTSRELQVWMIENLRENLSVERLAKRMAMSSRNFTRVCLRETRMNPGQFVDRMRVEAAQQMIAFHESMTHAES